MINMTDDEFVADMRSRINPEYADMRSCESHERKRCADIIDRLKDSILSVLPENFAEDEGWMRLLETHGLMDQAMKKVTP